MTISISKPAPTAGQRPEESRGWYELSAAEALSKQGADANRGLSNAEARARLDRYGPNVFTSAQKEPGWHAFLRQYRDPMQIVLLVAGAVSGLAVRQWGTALVLFALTLFNAVLGIRQEGKAEASIAALQKMMILKSRVRRDGEVVELPADQLVPGDIVMVEAGDRIPADGRLVKVATLEVDESALTGESVPVPKQVEAVSGAGVPLGDRVDMVYMNTSATRGTGELVVTATGMATEVGHISGLLQSTGLEETPLTKQLNRLTGQIVAIASVALAVSVLLGVLRNQPLDVLFVTAIAFAVSAIPTGLPAVVTYLLAQGTTTLAAAGAIVKRLRSVETLGATSAINSDKTGTLTLNKMTAVEMAILGQQFTVSGSGYGTEGEILHVGGKLATGLDPFLVSMVLASDAVAKDGALVGDPTEGALVVLAAKGGIDAQATRQEYPRIAEVPFDAAYKLMATFHAMDDDEGRRVVRCFVKGAPDQLLARAADVLDAELKRVPLVMARERYLAYNEQLGKQGLRVMALARKDFDPARFHPAGDLLAMLKDLTLLALVGIVDPPRPEAKAAIATAQSAGIRVRMITGDHAVTAAAIAGQLGISGRVITGSEFSTLSDEEALRQIGEIGVVARVTPEDKVRLVETLKRADNIVAMTGDGVNDAPALKAADIGVAMGITGTDVAKEAAVMLLTDDNFATIVRAVELGRALYDNLMKYIRYQMGSLFGFLFTFLGAAIFNIVSGLPFLALQTLWVNFTVGVFQAIGLGMGEPTPGLMDRPPRRANEEILPRKRAASLAAVGLVLAASVLVVLAFAEHTWDATVARTMGMSTIALGSIYLSLAMNDELHSLFSYETLDNRKLIQMSGWSLLATYLVTVLGFLQRILTTTSLGLGQWLICIAVGSAVMWVVEIQKMFRRRALARSRSLAAAAETAPPEQTVAPSST